MLAGAGAHLAARGWLVAVRMLEAPLFLAFWGADTWGEWLLLTAAAEQVGVTQLGLTFAVYNEVVMAVSKGSRDSARRTLHTAQAVLLALGGVAVGVMVVLSVRLPTLFGVAYIAPRDAVWVLIVAATAAVLRLQIGIPHAALSASGRYPLATTLSLVGMVLAFLPLAVLLPAGRGPRAVASALLVSALVEWALFWLFARRHASWAGFGVACVSVAELRRLFRPALKMSLFQAGQMLNTQGYRIAVGLVLGAAALAQVNVARTFCNSLAQGGTVVGFTFQPELAAAYGAGDTALFRKLARQCFRISMWTGLLLLAVGVLGGSRFIDIWTGGRVHVPAAVLVPPLIAAWLDVMWRNAMIPSYATNRAGRIGIAFFLCFGGVAVAASWLGAHFWGLGGALGSLVLPQLMMLVVVLTTAPRQCGDTAFGWVRAASALPLGMLSAGWQKREAIR